MNTSKQSLSVTHYEEEIQEFIAAGHKPSVLIVDDSRVVRTAIREMLVLANIEVVEAESGCAALEMIFSKAPDLILLDVMMPDISGISVLKTIRNSYSKLELPVILVAPMDTSGDVVQALDVGANDYITKPVDFDVMWARISNQLMQKQAAEYMRSSQNRLEQQVKKRTAELNASNIRLKREIKERILAEDKLQKQASYDQLTGLPNRNLATDRLQQTLIKAQRHQLRPCVAFVDLDNFKYVNDTLGHAEGDALLKEASQRLLSCARKSDTVARLGGDEFMFVLDDDGREIQQDRELAIRHVGDRILDVFAKPFELEGKTVSVTPSVGFAIYPEDGDEGDTLLKHADESMYRSKHNGRNTYCFYSPEMTAKARMRLNVESQLRKAMQNNELSLHYQPIVNVKSGKVIMAEALLHWNSSELGVIKPDYFIPIAEDTGMIVEIGDWIINSACEQIRHWREQGQGNLAVTINVSARQMQDGESFINTIDKALKANNLRAEALQIEINESALMSEPEDIINTITTLKKMGIKVMLDDFGTGYASLSYLQRYQCDFIKIDRSCINNVLLNEQDTCLVNAIVALADSLGMSVVCEGVENKRQLDFLRKANCQYAQGYYYSRPLSPSRFTELLTKSNDYHVERKVLELVNVKERS